MSGIKIIKGVCCTYCRGAVNYDGSDNGIKAGRLDPRSYGYCLNCNRKSIFEGSFETELLEDKSEVKSEAIKSDGGKSDYYLITVNGQTFMAEDFIKQVFGNDFDYGNNFKASLRAYALKNGTAKEGSTIGYETNKMKYYAGQIEKHNE
jgi:hypothetical protein